MERKQFAKDLEKRTRKFAVQIIDGFAKSRHSGENRSPETLQLIEKKLDSGFRRNDKKWCFSTFYEFINIQSSIFNLVPLYPGQFCHY